MRKELMQGTTITLFCDGATKQFQIDQVIGDGASCIAYEAHQIGGVDHNRRCRIKECYPHQAEIVRQSDGKMLIWESDEERQKAFGRLRAAHDLMVKLRNNEQLGNNLTSETLYEGNGTLYSVMDVNHGRTYDQDTDNDLHSILDTMKVLTEFVGSLHDQGYLHLDIKPNNFLVTHKPNTNVWLFDVDSLTPIKEIEEGLIRQTPYSEGWAAPEQLLGKRVSPATDLYAIGAILFEKVMGRPVSHEDRGVFADWDFEGHLFENVNPKVKRYLRQIFKKTLAASVKRRYESAEELLKVLSMAKECIAGIPYISTEAVCSTIGFVGRETECEQIAQAFQRGKRIVFLSGFSGIGKSELAKRYAQQNTANYDVVRFVQYGKEFESIQEWFNELPIENYEETGKTKARKIKSLFDNRTLILIDNFDIELGEDNGLDDLLQTKARILVTTRTDFRELYADNAEHIVVGELPETQLIELFEKNSGQRIGNDEIALFRELLDHVESHTYVVDLLARQLKRSGQTLNELCQEVRNGLLKANNPTKVISAKEGVKNTVSAMIRLLLRLADFSEEQKQVLRNMHLLSFIRMTKRAYKEIVRHEDINAFNTLVETGYIQVNGCYYTLHSLIINVIETDWVIDEENCKEVFDYVKARINSFEPYEYHMLEADYDEAENTCEFICHFLMNVSLRGEKKRKMLGDLSALIGRIDDRIFWFHFSYSKQFRMFVQLLEQSSIPEKISRKNDETEFWISYMKFVFRLRECEKLSLREHKQGLTTEKGKLIDLYNEVIWPAHRLAERDTKYILHLCKAVLKIVEFKPEEWLPQILVQRAYAMLESYRLFAETTNIRPEVKKYYRIPLDKQEEEKLRIKKAIDTEIRRMKRAEYEKERRAEYDKEGYDGYRKNRYYGEWVEADTYDDYMSKEEYDVYEEYDDDEYFESQYDSRQYSDWNKQRQRFSEELNEIREGLREKQDEIDGVFEIFESIRVWGKQKVISYIEQVDWLNVWLKLNELKSEKKQYEDMKNEFIDVYCYENSEWYKDSDEYEDYDDRKTSIEECDAILSLLLKHDDFYEKLECVEKYDTSFEQDDVDYSSSMYKIMNLCDYTGQCGLIVPRMMELLLRKLPKQESEEYWEEIRYCYPMIRELIPYLEAAIEETEDQELKENYEKALELMRSYKKVITRNSFEYKQEE